MAAAALAAVLTLAAPATGSTSDAAIIADAARIPTSQQPFAACVAHRESRGDPTATSSVSSSAGKWQFLQNAWGEALPYMVAERLRDHGMTREVAKALRIRLQARPIHRWSEQLQDVAFVAVLNARGAWSGWRHWFLTGSRCNALVPAGAR